MPLSSSSRYGRRKSRVAAAHSTEPIAADRLGWWKLFQSDACTGRLFARQSKAPQLRSRPSRRLFTRPRPLAINHRHTLDQKRLMSSLWPAQRYNLSTYPSLSRHHAGMTRLHRNCKTHSVQQNKQLDQGHNSCSGYGLRSEIQYVALKQYSILCKTLLSAYFVIQQSFDSAACQSTQCKEVQD